MKGKYCDYYWSVKKHPQGYVWYIRSSHVKGAKVLQSSLDEGTLGDKYYDLRSHAVSDALDAIQDYY